jgi:hypothetical protein
MFLSGTKNQLQSIEDLLREQNLLLRELVFATTGRQSGVQPMKNRLPEGFKPRTAKDVTVVTREMTLRQQQQDAQKQVTEEASGMPVR